MVVFNVLEDAFSSRISLGSDTCNGAAQSRIYGLEYVFFKFAYADQAGSLLLQSVLVDRIRQRFCVYNKVSQPTTFAPRLSAFSNPIPALNYFVVIETRWRISSVSPLAHTVHPHHSTASYLVEFQAARPTELSSLPSSHRHRSIALKIPSLVATIPAPVVERYCTSKAILDFYANVFSLALKLFGVCAMFARPGHFRSAFLDKIPLMCPGERLAARLWTIFTDPGTHSYHIVRSRIGTISRTIRQVVIGTGMAKDLVARPTADRSCIVRHSEKNDCVSDAITEPTFRISDVSHSKTLFSYESARLRLGRPSEIRIERPKAAQNHSARSLDVSHGDNSGCMEAFTRYIGKSHSHRVQIGQDIKIVPQVLRAGDIIMDTSRVWVITGVIGTVRSLAKFPEELRTAGVLPLVADFSQSDDELKKAAQDALTLFGTVDVLVNNAATGVVGPLEEVATSDIRAQFQVNFFGLMAFTQPFITHFPALDSYTDVLSLELKLFGVRVMAVQPGYFKSAFLSKMPLMSPGEDSGASLSKIYTDPATQGYDFVRQVGKIHLDNRQVGDPEKYAQRVYEVVTGTGLADGVVARPTVDGKWEGPWELNRIPLGPDSYKLMKEQLDVRGGECAPIREYHELYRLYGGTAAVSHALTTAVFSSHRLSCLL
ncbi:hypothetical protein NM688_g2122 [Phlebia brevispora]|uniref:Uncharacterized protein n=1 Tax=Phlebia brevispora TaxID=194682 RepID=A0ACC1TA67_9APHY|nr:hypothetical protein NM688_g2122 [Phlebia brevispora]